MRRIPHFRLDVVQQSRTQLDDARLVRAMHVAERERGHVSAVLAQAEPFRHAHAVGRGGIHKPFPLVFHGGSGSTAAEIAEAVSYGVVKMNIDTDTQYAFTRPIADHVFENYDKVLKIDGEVGEKKFYDPRSWGRKAEDSMSARVVEACRQLGSAGKALK